jgi:predicted AAA+ superfamily ATPase
MIRRDIQQKIVRDLDSIPAIVILGPRQVGKTTLAKQIAKNWHADTAYLDLERPSDIAKLQEPEAYLKEQHGKLIIIDEIQRKPDLFQVLRAVIDERLTEGEKAGQFLLLGSASLDIMQGAAESLAGRVSYIELGVLNAAEVAKENNINQLWLRGGFPNSYLADTDAQSLDWRINFIASYLERDIPALGPRIPAETLRRFWTMLAYLQGQIVDKSMLAGNIGVSPPTIARYLDLLVDVLLIRPLQPWSGNIGKRLVKRPKYIIRDSGLLHALLNIATFDDLMGHPIVGKSWEGFVLENLLSIAPRHATPFFYETSAKAEIELVFEIGPKRKIAIDVKRSLSPTLSKGFYYACKDIGAQERYIVYPGDDEFQYSQDVRVVSLLKMMDIVQKL